MRIPDHLTCLLRNLYVGKEATAGTGRETADWFQTGKEYIKAVYCHPAYLTSVQSISCEMPGWMNHELESRLLAENTNSLTYADDSTLMAESEEERGRKPLDEPPNGAERRH